MNRLLGDSLHTSLLAGSERSLPTEGNGLRCSGWKIIEEGSPPSEGESQTREAVFSICNGVIGVRGFMEESEWNDRRRRDLFTTSMRSSGHYSQHQDPQNGRLPYGRSSPEPLRRGIYVSGFIEQLISQDVVSGLSYMPNAKDSILATVSDPFCVNVFVGGELVSTSTGRVLSHRRVLNLRTGELHRMLTWESSTQRRVEIQTTRLVSCAKKSIAAMRFIIRAQNAVNMDVHIVSYNALPVDRASSEVCTVDHMSESCDATSASTLVVLRTKNSGRRVAVATHEKCCRKCDGDTRTVSPMSAQSDLEESASPSVAKSARDSSSWAPMAAQTFQNEYGCQTVYNCCDSDNISVDIFKVIGFFTKEDPSHAEDLCETAETQTRLEAEKGYSEIYNAHKDYMRQVWKMMNVKFASAPSISAAYRFNALKVFFSSTPYPCYGYPSLGLPSSSQSHGYHTWDVDAIIIPFLSHVFPQRARNLLEFRCRNLHHARANAQNLEVKRGAWYPFLTSHVNGHEGDVSFSVAYLFVNAVVAYAMRQYVTVTNDFSILFKDGGAEAIISTALLYLEWGVWDCGAFHLNAVSGPDEMAGMVDNNFFTNLMVQQHLEWAIQIASVCRKNDPAFWNELMKRNEVTEADIDVMGRAAANIVLMYDSKHRVHVSDQHFLHRKKWEPERGPVSEYIQAPSTRDAIRPLMSRYQLCQLPEVLLASLLLPEKFSPDELRANLQFYEPITALGGNVPISYGILSCVTAQLSEKEKARDYFEKALFATNLSCGRADGINCTSGAMAWWVVVAGFCGMRVVHGCLHFYPTIPLNCKGYQFACRHSGCVIKVVVSLKTTKYVLVLTPTGVEELFIFHFGVRLRLRGSTGVTMRMDGEASQYHFDGVICDINALVSNMEDLMYAAWKQVLQQFFRSEKDIDFVFTKELYWDHLKGDVPLNGLKEITLIAGCSLDASENDRRCVPSEIYLHDLCLQRNDAFRKLVQERGLALRTGALGLLQELRRSDILVGCVAGSACEGWLLDQCPQLQASLDCFVDGSGLLMNLTPYSRGESFFQCAKIMSTSLPRTILLLQDAQRFSVETMQRFAAVVDLRVGGNLEASTRLPLSVVAHSLEEVSVASLNRAVIEVAQESEDV